MQTLETTHRKTTFPPCYDYRYFQSLGELILNDEMAKLFAAELRNADKHPMLESLRKDLEGDATNPIWPESDSYEPCYDFRYFLGKTTITFNKSGAKLIADALNQVNQKQRIHPALWTMYTEIFRFFKQPSSAINQAAYGVWKFAEKKGILVQIPVEQYNNLCNLFERKELEHHNRIEHHVNDVA